ncbi:MAG: EamA family transporter [Sciscionella sp.]|nr:EamA family transporter [Sciscionella sp.]
MTALLLALLAAAGYGVSDFVGGLASRRVDALRVVIVSYPVGLVGMTLAALVAGGQLSTSALLYGAASGVLGGMAILWFYRALALGPMSVVSPLTAVLVAGLPLLAGMVLGERPGVLALLGAALAVLAVVLVSKGEGGAVDEGPRTRFTRKVGWLTVGSGAAFALYFVLLHAAPADARLWPIAVSRVASTALVLAWAAIAKQLRVPDGQQLRLSIAAGGLDALANGAFVVAVHAGLLSLVSVITSLYPATTVLLARLVLAERTGRMQRVGLVLAAVAVAMIASSP